MLTAEEYSSLLGPTGKTVLAYNYESKAFVIYDSSSKFIKENSLRKKAVTVDLKKGRIRRIGNWSYTYLTEENTERLKAFVKCPERP